MARAWIIRLAALALAAAIGLSANAATAHDDASGFTTRLSGFEETIPVLSNGTGTFHLTLFHSSATYTLSYSGLTSAPTIASIRFGQPGVRGDIVLLLCGTSGIGSPPIPACPANGGRVSGTLTTASIGPDGPQNVALGDFDGFVRILRSGDAYVDIQTVKFFEGELRGQIHFAED